MKVTFELKKCYDCKHFDHSGNFTHGGAIPLCRHMDVEGRKEIPHAPTIRTGMPINAPLGIPKWCPLKNGGKYQ